jgi:hypothetical protein
VANPNVSLTLDEAVAEVLGLLTGLDMSYSSDYDRYRATARQLNRALRNNALEHEWSYYSSLENVGTIAAGDREVALRSSVRARVIGDDAVRLADDSGNAIVWAYILPRDALHKYVGQPGLHCAVTRSSIEFSKPLGSGMAGLNILVPVMREPKMFDIPPAPENEDDPIETIPQAVRDQLVDFDYPDVVILRAAYQVAQSDPVMQPRVQTLEAQMKDLNYALIERDDRHTDSPLLNEFFVPIQSSIQGHGRQSYHHPHADWTS